jgi:hypothetical protein
MVMEAAAGTAERRPIGFWLKLVDRLIDEGFDALLGGAGLTRRHWQVLNALQDGPATVQHLDAALAPFLGGPGASTGPFLEDLAARGWVAWNDGQFVTTRAGTDAQAELLAKVSEHRRRVTAGISADEYLATVGVLRRMAANLGWVDAADQQAH